MQCNQSRKKYITILLLKCFINYRITLTYKMPNIRIPNVLSSSSDGYVLVFLSYLAIFFLNAFSFVISLSNYIIFAVFLNILKQLLRWRGIICPSLRFVALKITVEYRAKMTRRPLNPPYKKQKQNAYWKTMLWISQTWNSERGLVYSIINPQFHNSN